jgi:hypothetical protein
MLTKNMLDRLNQQVNLEHFSSNLYLSMARTTPSLIFFSGTLWSSMRRRRFSKVFWIRSK